MTGCLRKASSAPRRCFVPRVTRKAGELSKFRALEAASAGLGKAPVAAPVVVSFEDIVNPAGVAQPACTLCGDCCSGCNVGAKNTVAMTYLPDARAHGAEIFTELSVSRVVKADGGWHVYFAPSDAKDGGETFVAARTVVLAAGTLGSTEILLRSRERGLALSDRVGERFSANGDIIAFALGGREKVNAVGVGHPSEICGRRDRRLRRRPDRASRRARSRPLHDRARGRSAVGARAASARVLHRRGQAAWRGAEPHQGRLSWASVASSHLLRRLA